MSSPLSILFFTILFLPFWTVALPDSLQTRLDTIANNSEQIDYLNQVAWGLVDSNPDLALEISDLVIEKSKGNPNPYQLNKAYRVRAFSYGGLNDRTHTLESHLMRVKILELVDTPSVERAAAYYETGAIFFAQEYDDYAVNYFSQCIEEANEVGYFRAEGQAYISLGDIYIYQKELDKAEEAYRKGAEILRIYAPDMATFGYIKLNTFLIEQKDDLVGAKKALDSATKYFEKIDFIDVEAFYHQGVGAYNAAMGNHQKGLVELRKAQAIWEESNNPFYLPNIYKYLGETYSYVNGDSASKYFKKYIELEEQAKTDENQAQIAEMEAKYENEKSQQEIQTLSQQNKISELKNQRQQQVIWFVSIVGILILVLTLFIFSRMQIIKKQRNLIEEKNREVEEQKMNLEVKNKEVSDSINYATRIQQAILPSDQLRNELFQDNCCLYLPKDVLSGDFYWYGEEEDPDKNLLRYVVVGDCTGHGVPGALLSMLGINFLNASKQSNADMPHTKLNHLNAQLQLSFNSEQGEIRDGMDISIVAFSEGMNKMYYAGAKNPIYLIRNNELEVLKTDRFAIGQSGENEKSFSLYEKELQKGDIVYLFSDGFADQFGGDKSGGKKYSYKRFKELLLSYRNTPMKEITGLLSYEFESWKGDLEQLDDICIIGIRV